jgi:hypothetical protein
MFIGGMDKNNKMSNYLIGDEFSKKQKLKFFYNDILNDIDIKKDDFVAKGFYNDYSGKTKTTFSLHPFLAR